MRALVNLREVLPSKKDLAHKLAVLERSLIALNLQTRRQFNEVYEAIRALMGDPQPKQRPIGFSANFQERKQLSDGLQAGPKSHACTWREPIASYLTTCVGEFIRRHSPASQEVILELQFSLIRGCGIPSVQPQHEPMRALGQ